MRIEFTEPGEGARVARRFGLDADVDDKTLAAFIAADTEPDIRERVRLKKAAIAAASKGRKLQDLPGGGHLELVDVDEPAPTRRVRDPFTGRYQKEARDRDTEAQPRDLRSEEAGRMSPALLRHGQSRWQRGGHRALGSAEGGKACTGDAPTDVITSATHGYANGNLVRFSAMTGGAGLVAGTHYYVRDATTSTFKVSLAPSGPVVDITTNLTVGTVTRFVDAATNPGQGTWPP